MAPDRGRQAGVLLLAVLTWACGAASDDAGITPPPPAPAPQEVSSPEALYRPPDPLPTDEPGDLVRYTSEPAPVDGARAWRILYVSESLDGEAVPVTAMAAVPASPPPSGGYPVVSWAHPSSGAGDECAPSREGLAQVLGLEQLLADGFAVVATDYRGLGTPGLHPYLVGETAGRDVIDAARALEDLPEVATSSSTLFWGYSQGGQAAVFAAQQAGSHAPELSVEGTLAAAPAADLRRLLGGPSGRPPLPGVAFLVIGTWAPHYGLDAETVLSDAAVAELPRLEEVCDPNALVADVFPDPVMDQPVLGVEPWPGHVADNIPGRAAVPGPVLLIQGAEDQLIDPQSTGDLFRRLCDHGAVVELRRFPQAGHGVALRALDESLRWLRHRHAGEPAADECPG